MGVVNANDDSFFYKSRFKGEDAVAHIEKLINEGADIIDLGEFQADREAKLFHLKRNYQG